MIAVLTVPCPMCWGQGKILEPGPLGYVPVVCDQCRGRRRVAP